MTTLWYDNYIQQIANMVAVSTGSSEFGVMIPGMIDYAEQRIYRDLDLLYTQVTDASASASSGNRNFSFPVSATSTNALSGTFIIVDNINVITPVTATSSNGTRNQVVPVSREFIDITYPSGQTATGVPQFFAMLSNTEVIFGPSPDAAYDIEVVGIQRPNPISSGNSSTILTQYVPDMMMSASMIYISAFQQNFSAQGDNPQQSAAWEATYTKQMQTADVEQMRAKFESEGWTSNSPSPLAKRTP